jgi:hypothetical protein
MIVFAPNNQSPYNIPPLHQHPYYPTQFHRDQGSRWVDVELLLTLLLLFPHPHNFPPIHPYFPFQDFLVEVKMHRMS